MISIFKDTESVAPASGLITVYSGALADIPAGWVLCDGNNGTPNLLGRTIRGVPSAGTNPGSTGGQSTKTLSSSQMPSHSHTGSLDQVGDHIHYGNRVNYGFKDWSAREEFNNSSDWESTANGGHTHTVSVDNAGGGSSINNEPAHIEQAYIMKT